MLAFFHCATCNLRFPAAPEQIGDGGCPRCAGRLHQVAAVEQPQHALRPPAPAARDVVVLLDNIRSALNVGTMLRTADAAGITEVALCGLSAPGDHPKVAKTALGAELSVRWRYFPNALDAATDFRAAGYQLYVLENIATADDLFALNALPPSICLIAGNEIAGVDPALIALADRTVAIPMRGKKESLNVAVAFGIACYALLA